MANVEGNTGKRPARRTVLMFVLLVDTAAVVAVLALPRVGLAADPVALLIMVGLAALTGYHPVVIRPLRTTVSASDPFLFATIVALGGLPAVLVGLTSIVSSMIGARMRFSLTKTPFNLASAAISIAAASSTFDAVNAGTRVPEQILPLTLATSVYFLVNSTLIAGVISINDSTSFFGTWTRTSLWNAATIYCSTTLAVGLLFVVDVAGPAALILGVPPLWFFRAYHKSHRDHLREQRSRMEQIIQLNKELEAKVQARTAQLAAKVEELERARTHLRELAHTDELTMLANRRRFRSACRKSRSGPPRMDPEGSRSASAWRPSRKTRQTCPG